MFTLVQNTLRIIMLLYKLKVKFFRKHFHPISICCIGICQQISTIFKIWLQKRDENMAYMGKIIKV